MKKHQLSLNVLVFVVTLQCLSLTGVFSLMAEELPEWQMFDKVEFGANKKRMAGKILHTTDQETRGAGFHCLNRDLAVFLAAEPFDFEKLATVDYRSRVRAVRFSIDDGSETEEHWGVRYTGRVYSVQQESSRRDIFQVAMSGGDIDVTPEEGEKITISLPAINPVTLAAFIGSCNLRPQFLPVTEDDQT